ncbi:hypothetical protein GCM10010182_31880 [Actinomadura cremea]|nr:hypothetical protein GCM10010182_31880 [Actinomadura cremea]
MSAADARRQFTYRRVTAVWTRSSARCQSWHSSQWVETGVFAVLTLGLSGFCFYWVRRRLS